MSDPIEGSTVKSPRLLEQLASKFTMSPQPWHGLSHTKAWGHVGDSYSDIAQADSQHPHSDVTRPTGLSQTGDSAAGVLSRSKPRGAGTFQLQVWFEMSLRLHYTELASLPVTVYM